MPNSREQVANYIYDVAARALHLPRCREICHLLEKNGLVDVTTTNASILNRIEALTSLVAESSDFRMMEAHLEKLIQELGVDASDANYAEIRMELKTQAVLDHLRKVPADYSGGRKTLESLFPSSTSSADEKNRRGRLADALNASARKEIDKVTPLLERHSRDKLTGDLRTLMTELKELVPKSVLVHGLRVVDEVNAGQRRPIATQESAVAVVPLDVSSQTTADTSAEEVSTRESRRVLRQPGRTIPSNTSSSRQRQSGVSAPPASNDVASLEMEDTGTSTSLTDLTINELEELEKQALAEAKKILKRVDLFREARERVERKRALAERFSGAAPSSSKARASTNVEPLPNHCSGTQDGRQASNFDADVLGDGVNSQGNRSKDGDSESAQSIALQKATRRLERGLSRDDPLAASLSASDQLRRKDKSPKKRFLSEKRGGPAHQTESVPDIIHDRAAGIRVPWNASDDDIEDSEDEEQIPMRSGDIRKRKSVLKPSAHGSPPRKRTVREKFTRKEEEFLRQGVNKYGRRWEKILSEYDFHHQRTGVDLKDKYTAVSVAMKMSANRRSCGKSTEEPEALFGRIRACASSYGLWFEDINTSPPPSQPPDDVSHVRGQAKIRA